MWGGIFEIDWGMVIMPGVTVDSDFKESNWEKFAIYIIWNTTIIRRVIMKMVFIGVHSIGVGFYLNTRSLFNPCTETSHIRPFITPYSII